MLKLLLLYKKHFLISVACMICGAYAQVRMPFYSAEVIKNIDDIPLLQKSLTLLVIFFFIKSILMIIGQTASLFYKESIRLALVRIIASKAITLKKGSAITLIKEDCERITWAIVEGVEGIGATILFLLTIYATATNNNFLAFIMVLFFIILFFYILLIKSKVKYLYSDELKKEEAYKSSLMSAIANRRNRKLQNTNVNITIDLIDSTQDALNRTITANLKYSLNMIKFESLPQICASVIVMLFLIFLTTVKQDMLGPELVMYLGYIFLFTITSQQVIHSSISLISNKHSFLRLSSVVNEN